jgi:uncharacterized protein YceK
MKRIIATLLIVATLSGCGQPLTVHERNATGNMVEKTYPTYGLLNADTDKSNKMCYELSVGNVILSVVFIETLFIPIYFVGWSLYNPTRPKSTDGKCGIDA